MKQRNVEAIKMSELGFSRPFEFNLITLDQEDKSDVNNF